MTVYTISHTAKHHEEGDSVFVCHLDVPSKVAEKYLAKDVPDAEKPKLIQTLRKKGAMFVSADVCGTAGKIPATVMSDVKTGQAYNWAFYDNKGKMTTMLRALLPGHGASKFAVVGMDLTKKKPNDMDMPQESVMALFREMELTNNGRAIMNAKHFPLDPGI